MTAYRSIFAGSTAAEREENFRTYFTFSRHHSGELIESDRDLVNKRAKLKALQDASVRSRKPLPNPEAFYRNYVNWQDRPQDLDRVTLLMCCLYKFARHEWVGIMGAWDAVPSSAESKTLCDQISRYHLAEEFCHVRLFHEMFRTMQLDKVEWVPLGPVMSRVYSIFPHFPGFLMDAPAFVTELMGIVFYQHVDRVLDAILGHEPEARDRIRALLHEIMIDELAHVGQRRNFIGPIGTWFSRKMVSPFFRAFFHDIPETKLLFDIDAMVRDGLAFDYTQVPMDMVERSWVPSYCRAGA